jgi:acyl-CoA synthetase (AMP-forming)/AMP-acid ligase II
MTRTNCLIHHFLEQSVELSPDKTAVVHERRRAGYCDINRWANQLAHGLIQAGVKPGDRIGLLCENSIEYVFCYYGILKASGIVASLNTEIKLDGLEALIKELEPKVLIVSSKLEKTARSLELSRHCVGWLLVIGPRLSDQGGGYSNSRLYEELADHPDGNPNLKIDPESCAAIIYTSGSAGKPKGAMLSHANIAANTRAIIEFLELTSNDIQMVVLPFFYVMGLSLLNTHIAVGGTVIINNKFAYTTSVLKQMAEEKVTGFSGVPSTYAHLLFKSPLAGCRDKLPALRYCSQAGGHMPKHIKLELLKILPSHTRLIVMYGATEASARLTYIPPEHLESKLDSIGIPIAGVTMSVMSPEGNALEPGEPGELVARGDNIMLGYYKDEEATKKVLDEYGYHTGDLGYYDEDGYFYVVGRKDDQIKVGGHRLNPSEIEDIIIESGHAVECIILTIEDAIMGHKLAGLVVPIKETAETRKAILDYCYHKLPKYKVPVSLLMVETIPKNSSGKPDRLKSSELYEKIVGKETGHHA